MGSEVCELTIDDVLTIFEEIVGISRFQGLRSRQLLESAVHAPFQAFDGAYRYNSLFTMAAALMRSISENQHLEIREIAKILLENTVSVEIENA
jgi:hypothetical protein